MIEWNRLFLFCEDTLYTALTKAIFHNKTSWMSHKSQLMLARLQNKVMEEMTLFAKYI